MNDRPGALPPSNPEAEERVLGAILLDPGCLPDVLTSLKAEHFYRTGHRLIYGAMPRAGVREAPAGHAPPGEPPAPLL